MEGYYQVLDSIIRSTDSSLVLFLVILAALVVPLYGLLLRDRKHARAHEAALHDRLADRENIVLGVVRENTAALSECVTTMHKTNNDIARLHERLDQLGRRL